MTFTTLSDSTRIRTCRRGRGPRTFVLVHGWKQSHRLFDRVTAELEKDSVVLAFDQRGMGESDKPDCAYDFDTMAQDLLELLELHDLYDCCVLGWSMGCTTTLSAAMKDASRIGRIVLMNGPLRLTRTPDFPHALSEAEFTRYVDDLERTWPRDEPRFFRESLLPENQHLATLLEIVGLQTPLDVALALVRQQAMLDMRDAVRSLGIPIRAAYSTRDPYWPLALGEWIAEEAQLGSLTPLHASAHCAPLEEPMRVSAMLREFAHA